MATSYHSTVFEQPADRVWARIRDFGDYEWAGTGSQATMEEGRPGDAVGGVRAFRGDGGTPVRQRLRAHSDVERSYTYEFCDPCPFPIHDYLATLRVTPVIDGDRAFVEWWATFDCAAPERDHWSERFNRGFAGWLAALRARLER
jgi:hypothetical protein